MEARREGQSVRAADLLEQEDESESHERVQHLPFDSFVTELLIDGAELNVRAELAWLEEVAAALRARYAPPSA